MIRIVVDNEMSEKLRTTAETVLVCDETGRILGQLVRDSSVPEDLDPDISEEELDRRERAGGGRPLSEILRDLESRQ
jgi:hypothetical protein